MRMLLVLLLIFAGTYQAGAQSPVYWEIDTSVVSLVQKYRDMNSPETRLKGFRVQLVARSGNNSKKEANDVKAKFLSKYPDVPAYVIYQQPNFKVRVGNFRDRYAAYRFFKMIRAEFPSAFIVSDEITTPVEIRYPEE